MHNFLVLREQQERIARLGIAVQQWRQKHSHTSRHVLQRHVQIHYDRNRFVGQILLYEPVLFQQNDQLIRLCSKKVIMRLLFQVSSILTRYLLLLFVQTPSGRWVPNSYVCNSSCLY